MHTGDLIAGILGELAITHEGVKGTLALIVDTEDYGVVVHPLLRLEQLVRLQALHLELALFEWYLLSHPLSKSHLLDIVILIRSVHHHGYIVPILLLGDASVDSQVAIAEGVNLE